MAARADAIASATAGMVPGLYHRCGFGVPSGSPSRCCTTSWAALTCLATDALASKACGSVFGLLMIAVTLTYLPPTWAMTSAYWLSAPTAAMRPPDPPDPPDPAAREQAAAASTAPTDSTTASVLRITRAPRSGQGVVL